MMAKPLFSWVKFIGAFPVNQGKGRAAPAIEYSIALLKQGYSLVLMPEGERSRDGRFLSIRPGDAVVEVAGYGEPIIRCGGAGLSGAGQSRGF